MSKKSFPAIKIQMGSWEYFSLRMKFKDLSPNIKFAHDADIGKPSVLDEMIQREIKTSRSFKSITNYIVGRDDRFFSSMVVACLGSTPSFTPVIPNDEILKQLGNREPSDRELGYVTMDQSQNFFVLDGQHRMLAVENVLEQELASNSFGEEEVNVLLVSRDENEPEDLWRQKYRRLFTSLNRYAKPTDNATNIIMDEDDIFYIVTRMLIEQFSLFQWPEDPKDNPHIAIRTGGNATGQPYFTALEPLAHMNETLLSSNEFNNIWGTGNVRAAFRGFRPEVPGFPDFINEVYAELEKIWTAILFVFPEFEGKDMPRAHMRNHNTPLSDEDYMDHALLWPINQKNILAPFVRELLDDNPEETYEDALSILQNIEWDMRKAPWKDLMLIKTDPLDNESNYRMATSGADDAKSRASLIKDILRYLLDLGTFSDEDVDNLKADAFGLLYEIPITEKESWWIDILNQKSIS